MSRTFMRMWGAPIALAALTIIGLISALVGDGVWDHVSAVALGVPVKVILVAEPEQILVVPLIAAITKGSTVTTALAAKGCVQPGNPALVILIKL